PPHERGDGECDRRARRAWRPPRGDGERRARRVPGGRLGRRLRLARRREPRQRARRGERRRGGGCRSASRGGMTGLPMGSLTAAFVADRPLLWGLCYRMTGSAADADDIVQETFTRALEHPPARSDEPWRPWLVRVAMNLAHDVLR